MMKKGSIEVESLEKANEENKEEEMA